MMNEKLFSSMIASLFIISLIVTPALGVSISYSGGDSGTAMTSSGDYKLDDSTALSESTIISMDNIYQERHASGSGLNNLNSQVSGNGRSIANSIQSSGTLTTSSAAAASGEGAALSQNVQGSGDASTSVQGQSGSASASQDAGVAGGSISSSQSISAGMGVASSQKTKMQGETGSIGSGSDSKENIAMVSGGFSGQNNMEADLSSGAAGTAGTSGKASISGMNVLDDETQGVVASGDNAMSVDGLYVNADQSLGQFGVKALNLKKSSQDGGSSVNGLLTGPVITTTGSRSAAYLLTGWRWNAANPQIKWYLRDDAYLRNEGLTAASVAGAITAAANTWDDNSDQNLFADTGMVTVSTTVTPDVRDYKNTQGFKPFSSTMARALAYSRTWYSYTKVGGFYSATESDVSYNTGYSWSTSGTRNYDVQSVALHEMGHTLGLGDLYGKAGFTSDTRQVMHYYTGVKRALGNGDKTGLWTLYH
jgi:hypothetical protein